MIKIFFPLFLLIFPLSLSARTDTASKEFLAFRGAISHIISIGRLLDGSKNTLSRENLFLERDTLILDATHMYETFELRALQRPTLDISKKYKLTLQKYKLSCEIAALRMVIEAFTKKPISEEKIFRTLPIFPAKLSNDGIWGDPEKEFVGSYTGSQRNATGYGVYEAPLARYLERYPVSTTISNGKIDNEMFPKDRLEKGLNALHSGSYVIVWGDWCTSIEDEDGLIEKVDNYILRFLSLPGKNSCDRLQSDRTFSWKTQEGNMISGLSGEHAFLLLGYLGPLENPTHIIVWDTDTGKHIYRTSEWVRKWGLLDYRMLIASPKDMSGI